MEILVTIVIVVLVISTLVGMGRAKLSKSARERVCQGRGNVEWHYEAEENSYIAVDFDRDEVVVGLERARGLGKAAEEAYEQVLSISDIRSVEIEKDGVTMASTNRGSQALGTAVGAVALGGVGAIIGGLSGSSTSAERLKMIRLVVKTSSRTKPIHNITFFKSSAGTGKKGTKADSIPVKEAISQIETIGAHLENMLENHRAQAEARTAGRSEATAISSSAEIAQLFELLEKGALSEEEYEAEKSKVLSR